MHSEVNKPLISIIIPTLNEAKLVTQTLKQFNPQLKEKYKIEVIVSDGGSTDGTLDVINELADIFIENPPGTKQNISIGRNIGARSASGDFFYFFDADTVIPNIDYFFSRTLEEFTDPHIIALTCRFKVFPDDENTSDKIFHFCFNAYVRLLNSFGMGMGRGECQMIRRDVFEKAGGYNQKLPAGEDFELYRRIKKFGKIKFLKDIVVYESPRRYRKYGYLKVFRDWTINSLSVMLFKKAVSDEWKAVR